ncbi:MAG: DUF190 domain-containing protein [Anaerolineae bacterium]
MDSIGAAVRVTIYLSESDRRGQKPLYLGILELLKREHAAGATALHGLAGFGASNRIHTSTVVDLAADLPVLIEWVDRADRVERVLPLLLELAPHVLITRQPVEIIGQAQRGLRSLPAATPVHEIMAQQVPTIAPDAPVAAAIELLIGQRARTLPVLDTDGRLVGLLTDGDLLQRLGLPSAGVQAAFNQQELQTQLAALRASGLTVADLMHRAVITVGPTTPLAAAVQQMSAHSIKRLPVVDEAGHWLGLLSRVDVLRAFAQQEFVAPRLSADDNAAATVVGEIMTRDVPTVAANMPLDAVVSRLTSAAQRRAVVVDANNRVLGIITDGDLLTRATATERPGLLQKLFNRWARAENVGLSPRTAAQVMTPKPVTVTPDTPLQDALGLLLQHEIKRLPVVDAEGRLVGLVGRGAILQTLAEHWELGV